MREARGAGGDILSHVTHVLKEKVPGIRGSGNMWHRAYRAPGRLPVMVILIEDRYSPRNIVMRSEGAVMEVDPGDDKAIEDAYRIVSDPPLRGRRSPQTIGGRGGPPLQKGNP